MFLRIRNKSLLCGFDWEENPEKGLRQWKKVSISRKQNLCICVWERKKINSFEITLIIFLRHTKNVNLQFKKDFKSAELPTKPSFFLYFRDRPENGEGNKGDVESIRARVTKHASKYVVKAKVNLN